MSEIPEFTDSVLNLEVLVSDLARARAEEAEADAEYKAALADFEAENAAVINRRKATKAAADAAYNALAGYGVKHYEATSERKPHDAVEIKLVSDFLKPGEAEARAWALANMPGLLSVNWKTYEALFLARGQNKAIDALLESMPGEVMMYAKAYIARDLSAYLPAQEPEGEAVAK